MNEIRKIVFKLRLKVLLISNSIINLINKGIKINVVSAKKYKNNRKEDLLLQKYLLKAGYKSKVVAWEDNEPADIHIIRSVWGYHHNTESFIKFLDNKKTINDREIIKDNINKKKQYELLKNNNIPVINTKFLNNINELDYTNEKLVIKPIVSAAGDNTYKIINKDDLQKVKDLNNIMIQPFIENIKNGEISIIVINKKIKYGIKRFPGIFTNYQKEKYLPLEVIDNEIIEIVNKIIAIKEYEDVIIMRIDLVKEDKYKVLETELTDPDLFIETIPQKSLREDIYKEIIKSIKQKEEEKI